MLKEKVNLDQNLINQTINGCPQGYDKGDLRNKVSYIIL